MRALTFGWLILPVLGLAELGGHIYCGQAAPRLREWQNLRPLVASLRRGAGLVAISPRWAEPLARTAFGEDMMPFIDLTRPDESAYPRVIEISAFGQRTPELEGWREVGSRAAGPFVVRALENPRPESVRFSFVDDLDPRRVQVSEGDEGALSPCPWTERAVARTGGLHGAPAFPKKRFRCMSHELVFVGVTVIDDQEYRPRRCLWAHPPVEGGLRIGYSGVPRGRKIVGYSGLPWFLMREGMGPPVELNVRVDGKSVGTIVHRDRDGWKRFELAITEGDRSVDVEFRVSSDTFADRQFCFYADVR